MPRITLTDFVDVVSKSGLQKLRKVTELKNRADYSPMRDFYKKVREQIVLVHTKNLPKKMLAEVIERISHDVKLKNYPDVVSGYSKWWGRKELVWFPPTTNVVAAHGVEVSVNPELGLRVDGHPHLIKLYFKEERLSRDKITLVAELMRLGLPDRGNATLSILDIRNSKLHTPEPVAGLSAALDAELAYIARLWPEV